jgi:hypothetical protein
MVTERLGTKAGRKRRRREGAGGNDLAHFEDVLRRKHQDLRRNFYEVGEALRAIRDRRLYKGEFPSFERYCDERWDLARTTAYQLIRAADVVNNVRDVTPEHIVPDNEAQARPLTKLSADQQREVWVVVVETAPDGGITAKHVEDVVAAYLARNGGGNGKGGGRGRRAKGPKGLYDLLREAFAALDAAFKHCSTRPRAGLAEWLGEELRAARGRPLGGAEVDADPASVRYRRRLLAGAAVLLRVECCLALGPGEAPGGSENGEGPGAGPAPAGQQAAGDVAKAVQRWFRDLCKTYHPDRAGASSTEAMKVVNECHDRLKKALGIA